MKVKHINLKTTAAVDWLTVTTKTARGGAALMSLYERHKAGSGRSAKFFGFDCVRDEHGLTWGKRSLDGLYIFIAPGEAARDTWRKAVPVASKVTRIDLAVDVWLEQPRDQVKQSARVVLSQHLDTRLKYTYITGIEGQSRNRAGDTLYIGSRQSAQFGRLYDKGLQKGTAPPGKWLRYEVEYKAGAAFQMAREALQLEPGQLPEFISCAVHSWFQRRDVPPVFQPATDTPGLIIRSEMKQTTATKKLAWLTSQVKPTVQYLFEQGMRSETLRALDIDLVHVPEAWYTESSGENPLEGRVKAQA